MAAVYLTELVSELANKGDGALALRVVFSDPTPRRQQCTVRDRKGVEADVVLMEIVGDGFGCSFWAVGDDGRAELPLSGSRGEMMTGLEWRQRKFELVVKWREEVRDVFGGDGRQLTPPTGPFRWAGGSGWWTANPVSDANGAGNERDEEG